MISYNSNNLVKQFNNIYLKNNGITVNDSRMPSTKENSFKETFIKEIRNNNISENSTISTFDLKRVEQYYDGTYFETHPYGSYNPDKDYISPVVNQTVNGNLVFFPPKDAPDNVKKAFFSGLENMHIEDRKRVRRKIVSHHNAVIVSTSKHLDVDWRELDTKESWEDIYGYDNSYQNLFRSFVNHFKTLANQSSNMTEKAELFKHQTAHQMILDSFKEYGVK